MGTTHFQSLGFDVIVPVAVASTPGTNAPEEAINPIIIAVDGDPNTKITAPKGSLAISTGGSGIANRLWINTTGAAVWTAVSTVA